MNKTISINIGGTFFHIDENAYLKLKNYLDSISHSLNDDPQGKEEIIQDIELRISELLSEKISNNRQVVNDRDIDDIIKAMGQPEDYQYDDGMFNEEEDQSKKAPNTAKPKKLYRTRKEGIIGGVCKGLAYFFGIDVIWVRLLMLLLLIPNGIGLLVYIILWIIIPDAKTTAEELEMKGKPVTIDNIEKNIKDEYERLEKKVKNTNFSGVKNVLQTLIDGIANLIVLLFKIIVKFIGGLLVIIGGITALALIIALFFWGLYKMLGIEHPFISYPGYFNLSVIPLWVLVAALIFALSIPFFYLLILGLNILSDERKGIGTSGNLAFLAVWIISLMILGFSSIEHQTRFAKENLISSNESYTLTPQDTLFVSMKSNDTLVNRKKLYRSRLLEPVINSNNDLFSTYIYLDIRRSNSEKTMVKVLKSARGYNKENAGKYAKKIDYRYTLENNKLALNSYFTTPDDLKHHKPKLDVILYIPDNQIITLDESTGSFLYDVNNIQDLYEHDMTNHTYQMTSQGLNCLDCAQPVKKSNEGLDIDINKQGLNINVDDGENKARIKIDKNGIEIK